MPIMRFYWLDPTGHIRRPAEEIECENDDDARVQAHQKLADGQLGWSIEVWDGALLVVKRMSRLADGEAQAELVQREIGPDPWLHQPRQGFHKGNISDVEFCVVALTKRIAPLSYSGA